MKKIYITIIVLAVTLNLFAGRYAGDFMAIGGGVRAISMGGAYSAVADDANAIYWNTAGIGQIKQGQVFAMHAFLYNNLASYDNVVYCQPLPNNATIGVNWTRLTIDGIPYFDEKYLIGSNVDKRVANPGLQLTGDPDGEFKSTDDLFQLGFSKHMHIEFDLGWKYFKMPFDIYAGGNLKFIRRKLYENMGTGTGFDVSLLAVTDLGYIFNRNYLGKIKYGVNFMDLGGTDIKWDSRSDRVDEVLMNTKMGVALEQPLPFIKSSLLLAIDKDYVYEEQIHYGGEFNYDERISVRGGYSDGNYSTGLGISIYNFNVDYAFVTNNLGITNRIGLSFIF